MGDTITLDIPNKHSMEKLTPKLRWNNGILEQAVVVTHFEHTVCVGHETEWRPVPQAEPSTDAA